MNGKSKGVCDSYNVLGKEKKDQERNSYDYGRPIPLQNMEKGNDEKEKGKWKRTGMSEL